MLIVLFGLAGVGKNYVGKLLEEDFGYHFWDADALLTDEMQSYVRQSKLFTWEMREAFFQDVLVHIRELQQTHSKLAVAQAFYPNAIRNQLLNCFPQSLLLHIQASASVIKAQLEGRNNSVTVEYAEKIRPYFELPNHPCKTIENLGQGKSDLLKQLQFYLGS